LFSDGAFEIETADGKQWGLDDFLPLLRDSTGTAAGEPQRLYAAVRKVARPGPLDDDFSAVVIAFP
jgi:serine phosphatase RsbU (regulator of sigma subunit)